MNKELGDQILALKTSPKIQELRINDPAEWAGTMAVIELAAIAVASARCIGDIALTLEEDDQLLEQLVMKNLEDYKRETHED